MKRVQDGFLARGRGRVARQKMHREIGATLERREVRQLEKSSDEDAKKDLCKSGGWEGEAPKWWRDSG
jgi:hypothetical protein